MFLVLFFISFFSGFNCQNGFSIKPILSKNLREQLLFANGISSNLLKLIFEPKLPNNLFEFDNTPERFYKFLGRDSVDFVVVRRKAGASWPISKKCQDTLNFYKFRKPYGCWVRVDKSIRCNDAEYRCSC